VGRQQVWVQVQVGVQQMRVQVGVQVQQMRVQVGVQVQQMRVQVQAQGGGLGGEFSHLLREHQSTAHVSVVAW
jgi:hypothetical protein